jgi:soluble cytochrome b562
LNDAQNAAGWFLPPGKDAEEAEKFDLSVYQDQIAVGLRVRQAPDEFVTALKFASGAGPYFESQQNYQDTLATLTDPQMRLQLTNQYNAWKAGYLARRPIFANEIASAAGAQRRQQTIAEMRQLVYVNAQTGEATIPESQRPWHFKGLKDLQDGFDNFTATLGQINSSRSKVAQEAAKQLKLQFEDWAIGYIDRHPEVASYWTGVLAPEANLG